MRSGLFATVLAALVVAAAPAAAAESPAAVTVTAPAATMTISAAYVHHWLRIARAAEGVRGVSRRELERQVLHLLVGIDWIDEEAAEQGITVTGAEVQATFDQERRQSFPRLADFHRFLRQSRQTVADILVRVRNDLLSERIRDRVIAPAAATVTDADVDAALAAAGPERIPETRDIRVVLTATHERASAARAALAAGATWSAVARRYSILGQNREQGGLMRHVARGMLPPRLKRAVFGVKRGRPHGPIRTRFGYYVFEVVRIHPQRTVPLARQRAEIRRRLVADAQQKALDDFVAAFKTKWRSRTVCAPAYTWDHADCGNA